MKYKQIEDDDDEITFESTGRSCVVGGYPSDDIPLGISPSCTFVSYGMDGTLYERDQLTAEERRELAAFMIERWERFAEVQPQCGVELLLYLDGQSGYCTRPAGHTGMHTGTVAPDQAVTVT